MAEKNTMPSPEQSTVPYKQIRAMYDDDTITVYQAYNEEIATQACHHQKLDASPLFKLGRMTWIKPSWCWMMYRSGYSHKDANQARILAIRTRRQAFLELLESAVLSTESIPTTTTAHDPAAAASASDVAAAAAAAAAVVGDGDPVALVGCRIAMDGAESGIGRAKTRTRGPPRGQRQRHASSNVITTRTANTTNSGRARDAVGLVRVQWDPERSPRLGRLDRRSIQIGISGPTAHRWIEHGIVGIDDVTPAARALKAALEERPDLTSEELRVLGLVPEERELQIPESLRRRLGMD